MLSRSNVFQSLNNAMKHRPGMCSIPMQDLPSGVAQKEEETLLELDDIAKKLDMIEKRICPGC
jgi:hypothetical protein